MAKLNNQSDAFIFSFSDFMLVLKRAKWKILFAAIITSLAASLYTLTEPILYTATGSFKEKSSTQASLGGGGLSKMLGGFGDSGGGESISTLKSRKLMEKLVKEYHLQGQLFEIGAGKGYLDTIKDNLRVEWAYWMREQYPIFEDKKIAIAVENIKYDGERPLSLQLEMENETSYSITGANELVGKGKLEELFIDENYHFIVSRKGREKLEGKRYSIVLKPLYKTASDLTLMTIVEPDREDKSLLRIKIKDTNRHVAAQVINDIMAVYQSHLKIEHKRVMAEQLDYLKKRQNEVSIELKNMMLEHAKSLSADFANIGFIDTQKAIDFLAVHQHNFQNKQMGIDLEIKRLQHTLVEGAAHFDSYTSSGDSMVINQILGQIRELKQQYDSIEASLRNIPNALTEDSQLAFNSKTTIAKLGKPRELKKAVSSLLETIKANNEKEFDETLLADTHIEEILTHQKDIKKEFQGIDLNLAKELYIVYSREQNQLENQIGQLNFIQEQLESPNFEITSLGTLLTDPISTSIIVKAGTLILAMQDESNHSIKEQERLKEELRQQKGFLVLHVDQSIKVLDLKKNQLKEKVETLLGATLTLLQQQILLSDKQIKDYITARLTNLKQESSLIEKQQKQLHDQMAVLPDKWVAEQLINQRVEMNQQMGREITNLVESKNLTSNLEMIQSAPVDSALPPMLPNSPRLAFFALLGAFTGMFGMLSFLFVRAVTKGIPATEENLQLLNQKTCGKLSKHKKAKNLEETNCNIDTLRRLCANLNDYKERNSEAKSLLLLQGKGIDYTAELSKLLSKQGQKVLRISLKAAKEAKEDIEEKGFISYLSGISREIEIKHEEFSDVISSGGNTPYLSELLSSKKYAEFIKGKKLDYDWIVISIDISAEEAQARLISQNFDTVVITVKEQMLHSFEEYFEKSRDSKQAIFFTF